MNGINFQQLYLLPLFWLLPVILCLFLYAYKRRKQCIKQFCDEKAQARICIHLYPYARFCKNTLFFCAFAMILIALLRPSWNIESKEVSHLQRGRDVVFMLDVSNSMLAEDLIPNRLEMAKVSILDCLECLQGDRIALVAFAGRAVVECPLTFDYVFFQMQLNNLTTDSLGKGGTLMGDALRKVLNEVFTDNDHRFQDIILITDGEDHDSFPIQAAEEVGKRGIRLITIGLGDETQGQRIPITNAYGYKQFLKYRGQEVWSKLDSTTLHKMAQATPGGQYYNVSTGAIDLGEIYKKLISESEKKDLEEKVVQKYEEKYQIFLIIALILLYLESIIPLKRNI